MSIQTQAILSGHIRPEDIVTAIASRTGRDVSMRPMHRQTYKLVEFTGPAEPLALHLFLESSVAEDYREVTESQSTFVSAECSPMAREMVKLLAEVFGGFYRGSEQDDWERISPNLAS